MKKAILICTASICAFTLQTSAQKNDTLVKTNTHAVDTDLLFQKSKKQKTAAWLLLGGGIGMGIAGSAIISGDAAKDLSADLTTIFSLGYITPEKTKHSAAGPILLIAGTGAVLGSIPFFISAPKNKHKANLMLVNESADIYKLLNTKQGFTAVRLKLNL